MERLIGRSAVFTVVSTPPALQFIPWLIPTSLPSVLPRLYCSAANCHINISTPYSHQSSVDLGVTWDFEIQLTWNCPRSNWCWNWLSCLTSPSV